MQKPKKEVVAKLDLNPRPGTLYHLDPDGDVAACLRSVGHYSTPRRTRKVLRLGIKRERGYLYYYQTKRAAGVDGPKIVRQLMPQYAASGRS